MGQLNVRKRGAKRKRNRAGGASKGREMGHGGMAGRGIKGEVRQGTQVGKREAGQGGA